MNGVLNKFVSWPKDHRDAYMELGRMGMELSKGGVYAPSVGIESPYGKMRTRGETEWSDIIDVELRITDAYLKKADPKLLDWLINDEIGVYFSTLTVDDLGPKQTPLHLSVEKMRAKRGERLPLNEPQIYRNPEAGKIPRYIDYWVSILKSREKARMAGDIMGDIINDPSFEKMNGMISSLQNPAVDIVRMASKIALGVTSKHLQKVADKQLLFTAGTLSKNIDNLGLGRVFETESDYASLKLQVKTG